MMPHFREDVFMSLVHQTKKLDLHPVKRHALNLPPDAHHFTLRNQLRMRQFRKKQFSGKTRKAFIDAINKTSIQEDLVQEARLSQLLLLTSELTQLKTKASILYKKDNLTPKQSAVLNQAIKRLQELINKKEKELDT